MPQLEARVATRAQGCCHIPPLIRVPAPCTEPGGFDQSFQRAKECGRNSLLCLHSEQRASHRVIKKTPWKRSCSPLPAVEPWNAVPWGHPAAESPAWRVPITTLPLRRHWGLYRGTEPCPDPLPSRCSPCMAVAHPCLGMAGSRGLEVGRAGRDAGRVWEQECILEVLLKPCTAAPSPSGSTLWARADACAHSLAPTCPWLFFGLLSVEQLNKWITGVVLQSVAAQ